MNRKYKLASSRITGTGYASASPRAFLRCFFWVCFSEKSNLIFQLITSRLMHVFIITLSLLRVWINMAQFQQGGPDEKEKTTALKDLLSRIDLDELMKKDEPPLEFPDTLEGFEYTFNERLGESD
ncbi:protein FAM172A-like [Python bivittatus]|uniref:Protein FAM172A-like n=1 Tax=Python bivittatus TaxID=176946 RepID=A0A9F5IVT3_PYTBI|nr:protein FAM172A-like [Python bivittatus]